jgi:hypothetical protein
LKKQLKFFDLSTNTAHVIAYNENTKVHEIVSSTPGVPPAIHGAITPQSHKNDNLSSKKINSPKNESNFAHSRGNRATTKNLNSNIIEQLELDSLPNDIASQKYYNDDSSHFVKENKKEVAMEKTDKTQNFCNNYTFSAHERYNISKNVHKTIKDTKNKTAFNTNIIENDKKSLASEFKDEIDEIEDSPDTIEVIITLPFRLTNVHTYNNVKLLEYLNLQMMYYLYLKKEINLHITHNEILNKSKNIKNKNDKLVKRMQQCIQHIQCNVACIIFYLFNRNYHSDAYKLLLKQLKRYVLTFDLKYEIINNTSFVNLNIQAILHYYMYVHLLNEMVMLLLIQLYLGNPQFHQFHL